KHASAFSRHECPRNASRIALENRRGRREGRVSADTHGPRASKKARGGYHRLSRISGLPCATGLRLIARSPREPGLIAPVIRKLRQIANLASASGGQDHTPLPSASAPFVRTKNSRAAPLRPSQPASRPVTIGQNIPLASRRDAPTKS